MTGASPFVPPWVDRDELEQEAALARLEAEATGFDPDTAERRTRANFVSRERTRLRREARATDVFREDQHGFTGVNPGLGWLPEARKVRALSPPKRQTPGQRRKFLRNQLILVGHLAGFSQRQLGDALELPHSRIFAILDQMKARIGRDREYPRPGAAP